MVCRTEEGKEEATSCSNDGPGLGLGFWGTRKSRPPRQRKEADDEVGDARETSEDGCEEQESNERYVPGRETGIRK